MAALCVEEKFAADRAHPASLVARFRTGRLLLFDRRQRMTGDGNDEFVRIDVAVAAEDAGSLQFFLPLRQAGRINAPDLGDRDLARGLRCLVAVSAAAPLCVVTLTEMV